MVLVLVKYFVFLFHGDFHLVEVGFRVDFFHATLLAINSSRDFSMKYQLPI
jgi:hypothetical protein